MAKIYLIRHGQASAGAENYDVLSPHGKVQAERLSAYFKNKGVFFDKIFTGPLERQKDTALHFNSFLQTHNISIKEPQILEGLREHEGPLGFKQDLPRLMALLNK